MIDHTGILVADLARAPAFYERVLAPLGMTRVMQFPEDGEPQGTDNGGPASGPSTTRPTTEPSRSTPTATTSRPSTTASEQP